MTPTTHSEPAVVVHVAELKAALQVLSRVIRGRVTLPILKMVKVEGCPALQVLQLTATDLDLSVRVELPLAHRLEQRESFLVEMEDLQRVVKTADHPLAGIDLGALRVEEDVTGFPENPALDQDTTFELNAGEVEKLLHAFSCASEDQARYVLCGVCLDPADGGKMVATDGRHLVGFELPGVAALEHPFVLPDHRLWGWKGMLRGERCRLHLGTLARTSETLPVFRMEGKGWTVWGKGVQGTYPNWRQVIPPASEFVTRVDWDTDGGRALAQKLEQLAKWKETPAAVGLQVETDGLTLLHREKADQPHLATAVTTSRITGPAVTVMLDRAYLIKAPRFGLTCMELIDPTSPVKFSGERGFLIIMPLRCDPPQQPIRQAEELGDGEASAAPAHSPAEPIGPQQEPEQEQQTEPEPNMKPTNGRHPAPNTRNGSRTDNGNGHSAPIVEAEEETSLSDPMDAAVQQLALLRETLKGALNGMVELSATLKAVRQQQRDTEREIRTVKSTIRSLKEIRL